MAYAKIVGSVIVKTTPATPKGIATGQDGHPVWRPIVQNSQPAYDPATEIIESTETIENTQVVRGWMKRDKTAEELTSGKTAAVDGINGVFRPVLKILLDHENRIRAQAAPPQSALTLSQFKDAIKALL